MGIIDTLSAGFEVVRKRPWLILLPTAMNIGLWVAPKFSVVSLIQSMVAELMATAERTSAAAGAEALESLRNTSQLLVQTAEHVDLTLLLPSSSLGVPSLPIAGATSFFGWSKQVVELSSGLGLVGLAAGLALLGLLIGAFYLGLIAQLVRDGQTDCLELGRRLPAYWLRLIGASVLILGGLMFFGFPMALMMGLFGLSSQSPASMLMGLAAFVVFWIMLYLAFVPEAILFSHDGALRAIWRSISVVRRSFWSTIGLLLLINVITAGLTFIWERLTASAPGALVAIAANAYIGTGLTAALFVFYRERLKAWQAPAEEQRSQA